MSCPQIKEFDCGLRNHPRFPHQKKFSATKPLLHDVFDIFQTSGTPVFFNIEIKSEPEHYNLYQPQPKIMVQKVMQVVKESKMENNCLLQSFDPSVVTEIHRNYAEMKCSLLIEGKADIKKDLENLQFNPFGYNPHYKLITSEIINFCKSKNIQILAWTVNEIADMKAMAELGVDGIITDYPDRAISLFL
jgi:glycerophosphoryl diester phosphodiesterase